MLAAGRLTTSPTLKVEGQLLAADFSSSYEQSVDTWQRVSASVWSVVFGPWLPPCPLQACPRRPFPPELGSLE